MEREHLVFTRPNAMSSWGTQTHTPTHTVLGCRGHKNPIMILIGDLWNISLAINELFYPQPCLGHANKVGNMTICLCFSVSFYAFTPLGLICNWEWKLKKITSRWLSCYLMRSPVTFGTQFNSISFVNWHQIWSKFVFTFIFIVNSLRIIIQRPVIQ